MKTKFLQLPHHFFLVVSSSIGVLFPIGGIILLLYLGQEPISWLSIKQIHHQEPLLMIIWLAPLVLGGFGYVLDNATESIKHQVLLSEIQKQTLETIFETVGSAIISINRHGIVTNFNHAAEEIFGYQANEVIGKNVKILMPEEIASQHDQFLENYLATQKTHILGKKREIEARHKTGKNFPATLKVNELSLQGEIYFTGVIDDISEAKELAMQLSQSQKLEAVGQLASGIAHEINTPVQYIGDNLQALQTNFDDLQGFIAKNKDSLSQCTIERQQQWKDLEQHFDIDFILQDTPLAIKQSLEGIEQVANIVNAMKVFSYANGVDMSFANINNVLKNTLIICKNEYKYIADINTDFSEHLPEIPCYVDELNQVFLNLIVNAAHAIEEKNDTRGVITITTESMQDMLHVSIKDTGMGIPATIQDKVFNLFFTTKEVGKGSGQGLSIAYKIIVEKHHGKFYFDSVEGVGTTFHIELPLKLESDLA